MFHAHPRVLLKLALSRFVIVTEFCHRCGKRVRECWWSPQPLWNEVTGMGEAGCRCPRCFERDAEAKGILLRWVPRIEARKDSAGRWQCVPPDPELFPVAARLYREEQERAA